MQGKAAKHEERYQQLWLYVKYQCITKALFFAFVFPLFSFFIQFFIESTGRTSVTSGDYLTFLLSWQGIGALFLLLALLVLLVGVDINAFILASAFKRRAGKTLSAMQMLMLGLKSTKAFLNPAGVLIIFYVALIVPLLGLGLTISPMEDFQIPNFITSVIFSSPLYSVLYVFSLIFLFIISLRYIFLFHYVILFQKSVKDALQQAKRLMHKNKKAFFKGFVIKFFWLSVIFSFIFLLFLLLMIVPTHIFSKTLFQMRTWTLFILLCIAEFFGLASFMTVPVLTGQLTKLFYFFLEKEYILIEDTLPSLKNAVQKTKNRISAKVALLIFSSALLLANVGAAFFGGSYFDNIFEQGKNIYIVAHRGGGNLAAENSLLGIQKAAEAGAAWSEIDVQRTKDGKYIVHHDASFRRLSAVKKSAQEMTLAEIKTLRIKDLFDPSRESQPVATLEECLDAAKGKIGLFIELKGKTADKQMVDDIIKMLKAKDMERQCALLSLNYPLITYIESRYPEIKTGFLYFFAFGSPYKLQGDMLVMEEGAANSENIEKIQNEGKEAIVWTVNKKESIDRFVRSKIDGIISDYVDDVKNGLTERDDRTELELILDNIFP